MLLLREKSSRGLAVYVYIYDDDDHHHHHLMHPIPQNIFKWSQRKWKLLQFEGPCEQQLVVKIDAK